MPFAILGTNKGNVACAATPVCDEFVRMGTADGIDGYCRRNVMTVAIILNFIVFPLLWLLKGIYETFGFIGVAVTVLGTLGVLYVWGSRLEEKAGQ